MEFTNKPAISCFAINIRDIISPIMAPMLDGCNKLTSALVSHGSNKQFDQRATGINNLTQW